MVGRPKTKAGAGRQIPFNIDLRSVIEEHRRWYVRKIGEPKPEWYVFPGRQGRVSAGRWIPPGQWAISRARGTLCAKVVTFGAGCMT
jgi:hypothetical protein